MEQEMMGAADRRLSRSWAVFGALPVTFVAIAAAQGSEILNPFEYVLSRQAAASTAILIVGPFVSLVAASEMRVLVAAWGRVPVRRPWPMVVAARLRWPVIFGWASMAVVYAFLLREDLFASATTPMYPLLSVVSVVAWALFGSAAGTCLSPMLAYPLAVLLPYVAMAFPASWETLWLRHLTGVLFDCCSTSDVLSSRAVVASGMTLGALIVASVVILEIRLGPARLRTIGAVVGVVAVVLLGAAAGSVASSLGAFPTSARDQRELNCDRGVCIWPEDGVARASNEDAWAAMQDGWKALGLPLSVHNIGPISSADLLPLMVATKDVDVARASMVLQLPIVLSCVPSMMSSERIEAAEHLSWLVAEQLGVLDSVRGLLSIAEAGEESADYWYAILTTCAP